MIETGGYLRFERVDSVEATPRGLLAHVHGERLQVDVVSDDVLPNRGSGFAVELEVCTSIVAHRQRGDGSATRSGPRRGGPGP